MWVGPSQAVGSADSPLPAFPEFGGSPAPCLGTPASFRSAVSSNLLFLIHPSDFEAPASSDDPAVILVQLQSARAIPPSLVLWVDLFFRVLSLCQVPDARVWDADSGTPLRGFFFFFFFVWAEVVLPGLSEV